MFEGAVLLKAPIRRWQCPSCRMTHTTTDPRAVTPMHQCSSLKGIMAPYVEVLRGDELPKFSHVHRVIERGDYENDEVGVMHDEDGMAVMAVHTERTDGHDTSVFPAVARIDRVEVR